MRFEDACKMLKNERMFMRMDDWSVKHRLYMKDNRKLFLRKSEDEEERYIGTNTELYSNLWYVVDEGGNIWR